MTPFQARWVIERRQALGLTQFTLAMRAGISLPTLQNIEAEKANPSWDVLTKLIEALGYSFSLQPQQLNWPLLCTAGVPLMQSTQKSQDVSEIKLEIFKALQELTQPTNSLSERENEALCAFILAIQDHYPSLFKKYSHLITSEWLHGKISKMNLGRIIKLRRIALANIKSELLK